ncbi:MAG TPA: hypothetical protein VD860_17065 [Azospirillum sp.]|nr:hypothetical protein [Azospirillum sp.]
MDEQAKVAAYLKNKLWPEPEGQPPYSDSMRAEIMAKCQEMAAEIVTLLAEG